MKKVYVVGGNESYANWISCKLVKSVDDSDLVVFIGGTDVSSCLYNEPRHPMAQSPDINRDVFEVKEFLRAVAFGKKILGICRGGQLLCVLSGGKLIQHQDNTGGHDINYSIPGETGVVYCAADHHQAQWPWCIDSKDWALLGWTDGLCSFRLMGDGTSADSDIWDGGVRKPEVEDVLYRKTKALAIQSHPEWEAPNSPAVKHYRKLLDLHLANAL